MADLTGFRSSIRDGLVRPNIFTVELQFPSFVGAGSAASALGQFHCKAASLPASTFTPIPVFFQGRPTYVAGEREFQPWSVTVYNENFLIRDALATWSNGINNLSDNTGIIQPSVYQTDMVIKQKDRNGNVIKTITLHDAMPAQIGPIQLDFEANNQIEMFECVFYYTRYTETGVNA